MSQPFFQRKFQLPEEYDTPTVKLVIVNAIFYLITTIIGRNFIITGDTAIFLFGLSIDGLLNGFLWLPFTSIFVHAHIAHIGLNMIYLLIFGLRLEEKGFQDSAIYQAYIITGLFAGILSMFLFFSFSEISIGASGAVFGLLGMNVGYERRMNHPEYKKILGFSVLLFIFSVGVNTNVFAHLFGFITGVILGNSNYFDRVNVEDMK
jgi:rhomboid protease GluP